MLLPWRFSGLIYGEGLAQRLTYSRRLLVLSILTFPSCPHSLGQV